MFFNFFMKREINPPAEIVRRLLFVIYLFCWIFTILLGVRGLAQGRADYLAAAGISCLAGLVLKAFGYQSLEFGRLARSFPSGSPQDEIPAPLRKEVEELFREFSANERDWIKRQEMRRRLARLVELYPRLRDAYAGEIATVHASLPIRNGTSRRKPF